MPDWAISSGMWNAIFGNENSLTGGLVGAFALMAINYLVVRFLFRHRRLDQVFEGKPTVLVKEGRIVKLALAKELLTRAELMTVLHRQGFTGLDEVEQCVLEPGGTFAIRRKVPPLEEVQHQEVMRRLDEIGGKLDLLLRENDGA